MKNAIRAIVFFSVVFLIARWQVFNHKPGSDATISGPISTTVFTKQKDALAGQYVRLTGFPVNTHYLLGIGYYELQDREGNRIAIICDHYPPVENRQIDVVIYVHPLARTDQAITVQIEVKVSESPIDPNESSKIRSL